VCDTYDLLYGQNRDDSTTNFDKTNIKGALNTLNRKMSLDKLETNKLIYFSTETDSSINDNYMKSATIEGDNLISVDADIEKNSGAIKLAHNDADSKKAIKNIGGDFNNIVVPEFGGFFTIPKISVDRAGHVVDEHKLTISLPDLTTKYATAKDYDSTFNILDVTTDVSLDNEGELLCTQTSLGTLPLGAKYITNNKLSTITKDTLLNDVINKLIDNSDSKYNTLLGDSTNSFGKGTIPTLYGLKQGINADRDSISGLSSKIDTLNGNASVENSVAYSIK